MARTQRNKATMGHLGMLKARLAKLRRELIEPKGGGGGATEAGFDVAKTGDARIGFVGELISFGTEYCMQPASLQKQALTNLVTNSPSGAVFEY